MQIQIEFHLQSAERKEAGLFICCSHSEWKNYYYYYLNLNLPLKYAYYIISICTHRQGSLPLDAIFQWRIQRGEGKVGKSSRSKDS